MDLTVKDIAYFGSLPKTLHTLVEIDKHTVGDNDKLIQFRETKLGSILTPSIHIDISLMMFAESHNKIPKYGLIKDIYPIDFDSLPVQLNIRDNTFVVNNYLTKGGQALVYEGYFIDGDTKIPVIFRKGQYIEIPESIKKYYVIEYVVFKTSNKNTITIMEKLYPLKFSDKIFEQSMKYIRTNHLSHGDLTPNNILMDIHGNMKLIDYTPGLSTYTRYYSKNDQFGLSISLYEIKNSEIIKGLMKELLNNINNEIDKLSTHDRGSSILFKYLTDMGNIQNSRYNDFLKNPDSPEIHAPLHLLQLLHSIESILREANNIITNNVDFNVLSYTNSPDVPKEGTVYSILDDLASTKYKIRTFIYNTEFIEWLLTNLNNDKYDDAYLRIMINTMTQI